MRYAQEVEYRLRGLLRQLTALRIGPIVLQGFGGQQGAWRDQCSQEMLVKLRWYIMARSVSHITCQPMRKALHQFSQGFRAVTLKNSTAGTCCAGVVGRSQGNAVVERAGQQCRFAAARMTDYCQSRTIHKNVGLQCVNDPVKSPRPCRYRASHKSLQSRGCRLGCNITHEVGHDLHPIEADKGIAAQQYGVDHRVIGIVPAVISVDNCREWPIAVGGRQLKIERDNAICLHPVGVDPSWSRGGGCIGYSNMQQHAPGCHRCFRQVAIEVLQQERHDFFAPQVPLKRIGDCASVSQNHRIRPKCERQVHHSLPIQL